MSAPEKKKSFMGEFKTFIARGNVMDMAVGVIIGGAFGVAIKKAISQGAKRGLFSNEAGMGSTPHAHAQANVKDPHEQGVVAMIGVFPLTYLGVGICVILNRKKVQHETV